MKPTTARLLLLGATVVTLPSAATAAFVEQCCMGPDNGAAVPNDYTHRDFVAGLDSPLCQQECTVPEGKPRTPEEICASLTAGKTGWEVAVPCGTQCCQILPDGTIGASVGSIYQTCTLHLLPAQDSVYYRGQNGYFCGCIFDADKCEALINEANGNSLSSTVEDGGSSNSNNIEDGSSSSNGNMEGSGNNGDGMQDQTNMDGKEDNMEENNSSNGNMGDDSTSSPDNSASSNSNNNNDNGDTTSSSSSISNSNSNSNNTEEGMTSSSWKPSTPVPSNDVNPAHTPAPHVNWACCDDFKWGDFPGRTRCPPKQAAAPALNKCCRVCSNNSTGTVEDMTMVQYSNATQTNGNATSLEIVDGSLMMEEDEEDITSSVGKNGKGKLRGMPMIGPDEEFGV